MALKCYEGHKRPGARQKEPRLIDCGRNDDLCVSAYSRGTARDEKNKPIPRGTWGKNCDQSGVRPGDHLLEDFNGDFSERCIESTYGLTVCNLDILNNFSCRFLNPNNFFQSQF